MLTSWNTKRPYSNAGQRITVEVHYSFIAFCDHDRMIDGIIMGRFDVDRLLADGCITSDLNTKVMLAYDHNLFTWPQSDEHREALKRVNSANVEGV